MKKRKISQIVILLLVLLVQSLPAAEPKETKRVLILYSEDKDHPAHELTDRGIQEAFESNVRFNVQLYTEYLDAARFGSPAHTRALVAYLRSKYSRSNIDVIIAVYPTAVDILLHEAGGLFPRVPIVACEMLRPYVDRLAGAPVRNFLTATVTGENLPGMLDAVRRIYPGMKRIALIAGTEQNDAYNEELFRQGLKPHLERFELIDLSGLPMVDILRRVGSLPHDTIVLYASIFRDGSGERFVPRQALSMISKASNAPVFGLYDSCLGYGIVGGRLTSFEEHGKEAASLALRILGGESPASIPFSGEGAYVDRYDWRELKRWGIPESALLPGSEIRYRQHSLWEDHAQAIMGLVCVLMLQTGLIGVLVRNLRLRRKTERSLKKSEHRVRLAVSSAGAGLWSLEMATGNMWATEEVRNILGIAHDAELNSEKFLDLVHPEDRDHVRRAVQDALQSKQETRIEHRVVLPDGEVRWIASVGRVQPEQSAEAAVLTGVSADITQRKENEEKLRESEEELSLLAGRLISAQEEERSRVARELHDDFTQRLAVLAIDAGSLERQQETGTRQVREKLGAMKTGLVKISQDIHDLSRQLHPSILEDLGLVKAVQSECARLSRKEGLEVFFTNDNVPEMVPRGISIALYRIIQEGLRNIVVHSQARTAHLRLQGSDSAIELSIRDTGLGFEPSKVTSKPSVGISSMEERARLVHGDFSLDSAPGEGTVITVRVPLDGREP